MFVPGNRRWDNDGFECGGNRRRIETIGVQKHLHSPFGQKRALTGWARARGWRVRILRLSGRATVNNERLIESPAQKAGSSKTKKPAHASPHSYSLFHNGNCLHKIQKESVFTSRPSPQGRFGPEAPENTRTCFLTRFFRGSFHPRPMFGLPLLKFLLTRLDQKNPSLTSRSGKWGDLSSRSI